MTASSVAGSRDKRAIMEAESRDGRGEFTCAGAITYLRLELTAHFLKNVERLGAQEDSIGPTCSYPV